MSKFSIEQKPTVALKSLFERLLDAHTAPELESAIANAIEVSASPVVNFNDLEYISSAGLGVFMVFIEEVRATGGDIKLTAMKQKVFTVFDLLGFPMLLILPKKKKKHSPNFRHEF